MTPLSKKRFPVAVIFLTLIVGGSIFSPGLITLIAITALLVLLLAQLINES